MADVAGFPYREIQFTKKGEIAKPEELQAAEAMVKDEDITDLLVISHGWNNDIEGARRLYEELGGSLRKELDHRSRQGLEGARLGIVGILWPSKKFGSRSTAGGAASLGSEAEELLAELDELEEGDVFDAENAKEILAEARELAGRMEDDEELSAEFADLIRKLVNTQGDVDSGVDEDFLKLPGAELVDALSAPMFEAGDDGEEGGGAAGFGGGAAGFNPFKSLISGANAALNLTTFYQMKKRALQVGEKGANEALGKLSKTAADLRLHLVGHSFGGLLVSAAVNGPGGHTDLKVDSVSLLQAAFSHNGFADNFRGNKDGRFRPVMTQSRVKGPVIVTHTKNDKAVKIPYAIAARTKRQDAVAIGDAKDVHGAMGSNGAQSTPEVDASENTLKDAGADYDFVPGKVHNLLADKHISDHSDIRSQPVANAILEAARKRSG